MSDSEVKKIIPKLCVVARSLPSDKSRLVRLSQELGLVVGMTGDGVNDAPALKAADIGVGMGITGTEVSKSVSDIILTDDSFSTIVSAVREGRRIFDNIRNVLVYLLVGNIAEVIVVFIGMAMGIEIFSPIQLLYINLITDSIPAIALAFEKESSDVMNREVRKNNSTFFTNFLVAKIGVSAILKTITMLLVYAISYKLYGVNIASTMAFLTLIMLEMIYAFSCKNLKTNVIKKDIFDNKFMNIGMLALLVLQILIFITPVKRFFGLVDINLIQAGYCMLIVFVVFVIDELSKYLVTLKFRD
jgi:Ca2+-transporting ATPase